MEIILIILAIFLCLCLLSIGGWILEILSYVIDFLFQGVGHCLGNVFGCLCWIIGAIIFILLICNSL